MNDSDPKPTAEPTGRYGAGYGEEKAPKGAAVPPVTPPTGSAEARETPTADDAGNPAPFTADDVTARPPDHTPTENAPASEKAGLIFERS